MGNTIIWLCLFASGTKISCNTIILDDLVTGHLESDYGALNCPYMYKVEDRLPRRGETQSYLYHSTYPLYVKDPENQDRE
jgi:hypothetical protein